MFYKIIERKRDEWLGSQDCVVSDLVSYIERQHMMRDAQIDAIKTFLYLKIDTLTDFKIRCYARRGKAWKMLGYYYPDFILLTRKEDNTIDKVVIVETKGEGFAGKFEPRKHFMDEMFIRLNNEKYGRERFSFLYIEDTQSNEQRLQKTVNVINSFLKN